MTSFWRLFNVILASFWHHFYVILTPFGIIEMTSFWRHFDIILASSDHFYDGFSYRRDSLKDSSWDSPPDSSAGISLTIIILQDLPGSRRRSRIDDYNHDSHGVSNLPPRPPKNNPRPRPPPPPNPWLTSTASPTLPPPSLHPPEPKWTRPVSITRTIKSDVIQQQSKRNILKLKLKFSKLPPAIKIETDVSGRIGLSLSLSLSLRSGLMHPSVRMPPAWRNIKIQSSNNNSIGQRKRRKERLVDTPTVVSPFPPSSSSSSSSSSSFNCYRRRDDVLPASMILFPFSFVIGDVLIVHLGRRRQRHLLPAGRTRRPAFPTAAGPIHS